MVLTLLKTIRRDFRKHPMFPVINLAGLTVALAVVLIIGEYLYSETHFERMHSRSERIDRVTIHYTNPNGYDIHFARTDVDWVNNLQEEFPEVERLIRFQQYDPRNIRIGENKFMIDHAYSTDKDVFSVFDFQLLQGDPATALANPASVVLTQEVARRFFGSDKVMGREIEILNTFDQKMETYVVTGVMKDLPPTTHLPVNMLTSFRSPQERSGWAYVYLLLSDPGATSRLAARLPEFTQKYVGQAQADQVALTLQPIRDIHLHSDLAREIVDNGKISSLWLFSGVGLFILIMAAINFINLTAAWALNKSREVGVRKVLGSGRGQLSFYFILRSSALSLLAALFSLILLYLSLPYLRPYLPADFHPTISIPLAFSLALTLGILAAWFPASRLVTLPPVRALKETESYSTGASGRQILVALQLISCIVLLSSALIIRNQFEYMVNTKLGISGDHVMAVPNLPWKAKTGLQSLRNQLLDQPGVRGVTASMQLPSQPIKDMGVIYAEGIREDSATAPVMDIQVADEHFLPVMKARLIAGRNFTPGKKHLDNEIGDLTSYIGRREQEYILNETAVRTIGWKDPEEAIGKQFSWSLGNIRLKRGRIIGVIRDFHQESMKTKIDPLVMINEPVWLNNLLIAVDDRDVPGTIDHIRQVWNDNYPDYAMDFHFVDDLYDQLYQRESNQLILIYLFSGLAIFISFTGLFGLVTFLMNARIRELAIRKVLGATASSLTLLLSRDFIRLSLLGIFVAVPLTWYSMQSWLTNYSYRIEIRWWMFALAGGMIFGIFLLSILWQVYRSGNTRPAEILRGQ